MERGQKRRGYMMPTYYWLRHTFATNCCRRRFSNILTTFKQFNVVGAILT